MRTIWGALLLTMIPTAAMAEKTTLYRNAQIWTGASFRTGSLAVRDGRFVPARHARNARTVDLKGGFVVPAYANAHAHLTYPTDRSSWSFLEAGVYYVWNPNTVTLSDKAKAFFARPDTVDVKIAQGGITEPGGHPERLYVDYLTKNAYPGKSRDWFIGNAFHYGRDAGEIAASLDELKRQQADFVKIYLLYSEDYARRRDDPAFYGQKGLNAANVPILVREAKRRDLLVAAHVETVSDLLAAARAGVQVAAHVPLYWAVKAEGDLVTRRLSVRDAREVARSGMWLVPTYSVADQKVLDDAAQTGSPVSRERVFAAQAENLKNLRQAGATMLIGTDGTGNIFDEAEHLVRIGAYSPADALPLVFGTGPRLFPERRIGCFRAGCEADFLVLDADPRLDITNLRRIRQRVKAGRELLPPVPPPGQA